MPKLSSLFRLPGARPASSRSSSREELERIAARSHEAHRAQPTRKGSSSADAPGMSKRAARLNGQPAVNGTTSASNEASDETIDGTANPSARNVEAGHTGDADDASLTSVEALQPGLGSGSSGVYVVKREHAQHAIAQQNAQARSAQARDEGARDTEARNPHDHDAHAQDEMGRRMVMMNPLLEHVTLVVYGWHNVEPGTLSWVFPSVTAAVAAARAMKNAVRWAIVAGRREASDDDLIDARAHGAVLIEQAG